MKRVGGLNNFFIKLGQFNFKHQLISSFSPHHFISPSLKSDILLFISKEFHVGFLETLNFHSNDDMLQITAIMYLAFAQHQQKATCSAKYYIE